MGSTWTAIADPIFYFGVHWHIDRVFDDYKSLQAERVIRPLDRARLMELHALESIDRVVRDAFTSEERTTVDEFIKATESFSRRPGGL